jgi:hypothetical protein
MKFTVHVQWPSAAPTSYAAPENYESNATAITLAVPVELDRSCAVLRNKILRRFATQPQLQRLRLSDLADKDGALIDLEDTLAELFPEATTSPSDNIVRATTLWVEPTSRKRQTREEECARDVSLGPSQPASHRKRQRRSSLENGRDGTVRQIDRTQSHPVAEVIEDSQPVSRGRASAASAQSPYHTPSQVTPAPGGPASSNPAPTSAQRLTNSQVADSQRRRSPSALFVHSDDDDDESSGLVNLDDEILRGSDEEDAPRTQRTTQDSGEASSQWRNVLSSGKVCVYHANGIDRSC